MSEKVLVADKREYGVDCVKIFATILVILTHLFSFGGFLESTDAFSFKGFTLLSVRSLSLCCVNLFGIATGYLYLNRKVKYSKVFSFWIQVVFISVIMLLIDAVCRGDLGFIKQNIIQKFFPIINVNFWFFNSYFVLLLLINFYNILIDKIDKLKFTVILCFLFVILSVLPMASGRNYLKIDIDYSFVWLSFCYFCGAYIRKYEINKKIKIGWCIVLCLVFLILMPCYTIIYNLHPIHFLSGMYSDLFSKYNSVNIFFISLLVFLTVSRVKIKKQITKKMVILLSSASFAVYIIHLSDPVFNSFISQKLAFISEYSLICSVGILTLYSLVIFLVCSFGGILQIKLFDVLKVNCFCNRLALFLKNIYLKLYRRNNE